LKKGHKNLIVVGRLRLADCSFVWLLTGRYCRWWGIRIPSARNNCWL